MYCKLILSFALLAVASAAVLTPVAAPAYVATPVATPAYATAAPAYAAAPRVEEYDPNPQYTYTYRVEDQHTGDSKSQSETRHGDVVEGTYSLIEPDGSRRTVEYTADAHNGFNAVVHREPATHPVAAPAPAPVVVARPVVQYAAPVYRAAAPATYSAAPGRQAY